MSQKKPLLILVPTIAVALVIAAIQWDRYRTVPIERALNPLYWVQHWRGLDRYDPSTCLLEHGNPDLPEVALTIDDGPDPRFGPEIAAYLTQQHVAATFFVVGKRVTQYPAVLRSIAADGFEVGQPNRPQLWHAEAEIT